jgi:hypothetical protein
VGTKERQQQARVALEAAVSWLGPLPVTKLAAEVMAQFRPEPGVPEMVTAAGLAQGFAPDSGMLGVLGG